MHINHCFGILIIVAGAAQAQWMHGTVRDAVSRRPIQGAAISVVEIEKTCTTDSAGYYYTGLVPAGLFNATIAAHDYLMAFRRVIIASSKGPGISRIRFNAGLYHKSTNADTIRGKASLTYRFPGRGDIEITIKNGIGRTIRTMFDRSRAGGMRTFSWNGRDDDGNLMPPGRYRCKVSSGRLVIIRSLYWEGEPAVPPAALPARETPAQPKAEETPAPSPAIPAMDSTQTPEESPQTPAE
ncbi:MAG: carboxypeptidase regulatory-like domain-containing protein [Chitinispirillaceae bacterium]|nr:carboxypeptidase regulatory-like domain-containing protein [Chitinispirillaceae bacterium]